MPWLDTGSKLPRGMTPSIIRGNRVVLLGVVLGADKTVIDQDTTPFDSRAGVRFHSIPTVNGNNAQQQTGHSEPGGGAISTWDNKGEIVRPTGFVSNDYEFMWVEISDSGVSSHSQPNAEGAFLGLNTDRTWFAQQITAGLNTWVIDITVREKADHTNIDTVRITMIVEGL